MFLVENCQNIRTDDFASVFNYSSRFRVLEPRISLCYFIADIYKASGDFSDDTTAVRDSISGEIYMIRGSLEDVKKGFNYLDNTKSL